MNAIALSLPTVPLPPSRIPSSMAMLSGDESADLASPADIVALARCLLNRQQPGLLATVDLDGKPDVRWMSTLTFDHFPVFHSLTAPDSRKVRQIEQRADVNWMFFNHARSLILNLRGVARILTDTPTLKRVWKEINDKPHTYFLDRYAKGPGFVVIETTVDSIECTVPGNSVRIAIEPSELARAPEAL